MDEMCGGARERGWPIGHTQILADTDVARALATASRLGLRPRPTRRLRRGRIPSARIPRHDTIGIRQPGSFEWGVIVGILHLLWLGVQASRGGGVKNSIVANALATITEQWANANCGVADATRRRRSHMGICPICVWRSHPRSERQLYKQHVAGILVVSRWRFWKPSWRTPDDTIMRTICYHVRESAHGRKIAGNVLVVCRMTLQVATDCRMRVEHNDVAASSSANVLYWRDQIGIARNDDKRICFVFMEISHHCRRKIHVRPFLLSPYDICVRAAAFARFKTKRHLGILPLVIPFHNLDRAKFLQCPEVNLLVGFGGWLSQVIIDAGCEILHCNDNVVWRNEEPRKLSEIQPFEGLILPQQPVIQVESVYVNYSLFVHKQSRKMLEPGLLPAPLRIAKGSRVVSNPSRGSARIVPKCGLQSQGVQRNFLKFFHRGETA